MRPQTIRRPRSATLHEIEPVNKLFFQKGYDVVKQIDRTIMLRAGERIGPFNAYPGFGGQPRLNPARAGSLGIASPIQAAPPLLCRQGALRRLWPRPTIQTCDLCLRRANVHAPNPGTTHLINRKNGVLQAARQPRHLRSASERCSNDRFRCRVLVRRSDLWPRLCSSSCPVCPNRGNRRRSKRGRFCGDCCRLF
jgi:hypothetical protein